jgi:GT2 family glycosyltransferase
LTRHTSDSGRVAVTIITFNSSAFIRQCLRYLFEQDYESKEVIIVDNASTDGTAGILREYENVAQVVRNRENVGFAAGQNQAIALSNSPWVLTLNPDVRLTTSFIRMLVAAAESESDVGSVCGKLLAMGTDFEIPQNPVFDSAGIYMTRNQRHLDRGSRMPDQGQYDRAEYVFGGTGAACLYRRRMIEEISINGEFFDSDFFAYREDADVAWRAQLAGWKCWYTPLALAYHVRSVLPSNRRSVPAVLNMHSVKNRWLMRIKNMTAGVYKRYWLPITMRDLVVVVGCLVREWTSLRAFWLVLRSFPSTLAKRRVIMQRRRVSDDRMVSWFSN